MSFTVEKDWTTDAGFRAVVLMTSRGHRCGYVGVPQGHPLYGVAYGAPTPVLKMNMNRSVEKMSPIQMLAAVCKDESELCCPEYVFEVHGGLTFSDTGGDYPVTSYLHWFGFDCAHHGDAPAPGSSGAEVADRLEFSIFGGVHRSLDFCVDECESLARQIKEAT